LEKVKLNPYLAEAIASQLNRLQIASLLFVLKRDDLMPTVLEDVFYHQQEILDKYCIADKQEGD